MNPTPQPPGQQLIAVCDRAASSDAEAGPFRRTGQRHGGQKKAASRAAFCVEGLQLLLNKRKVDSGLAAIAAGFEFVGHLVIFVEPVDAGALNGRDMHEAVDILESAIPTTDPAEIYSVTHKALASSLKVIARADDSSGIIGDACRRLLELHPQAAAAARTPVGKLIDWMMKFQFDDDEVDYFELDPVAYAPALGEVGVAAYRKRLAEVEAKLGPRPSQDERWTSGHSHEWFTLDWNAQRMAVLDHDIDAIIRTHAKDRKVAAWLEDTAEAFEEIGEIDLLALDQRLTLAEAAGDGPDEQHHEEHHDAKYPRSRVVGRGRHVLQVRGHLLRE